MPRSRRTRGIIVAVAAAVLLALPSFCVAWGERRVNEARRELREKASSITVTSDEFLRAALEGDAGLASELGVDGGDVSIREGRDQDSRCLRVNIRRLLATGQETFLLRTDKPLEPVKNC